MILAIDVPNPIGWVTDGLTGAGRAVVEAGFEAAAKRLAEAADEMFLTLISAWQKFPGAGNTDTSLSAASNLQNLLLPMTAVVAVICLIFTAARAAWEGATTGQGQAAQDAGRAALRTVIVGSAGIALLSASLSASDAAAAWILPEPTQDATLAESGIAVGLLFMLGIFAIISSIIQIIFVVVRQAMIVLLAGAWQITAAGSATEAGHQSFKKVSGWLLAFVLYKPAAALAYAAAYEMRYESTESGDVLGMIQSVILVIMAVCALPAMMRLVSPAVGAIGSAGSVAGVAAGAAVVATGAPVLAAQLAGGGAAAAAGGGAAGAAGASGGMGPGGASGASGVGSSGPPGPGGGPSGPGAPGAPGASGSQSKPGAAGAPGDTSETSTTRTSSGSSSSTGPAPAAPVPSGSTSSAGAPPSAPTTSAAGVVAQGAAETARSAAPNGEADE